jgi:hypothetical protein
MLAGMREFLVTDFGDLLPDLTMLRDYWDVVRDPRIVLSNRMGAAPLRESVCSLSNG